MIPDRNQYLHKGMKFLASFKNLFKIQLTGKRNKK